MVEEQRVGLVLLGYCPYASCLIDRIRVVVSNAVVDYSLGLDALAVKVCVSLLRILAIISRVERKRDIVLIII